MQLKRIKDHIFISITASIITVIFLIGEIYADNKQIDPLIFLKDAGHIINNVHSVKPRSILKSFNYLLEQVDKSTFVTRTEYLKEQAYDKFIPKGAIKPSSFLLSSVVHTENIRLDGLDYINKDLLHKLKIEHNIELCRGTFELIDEINSSDLWPRVLLSLNGRRDYIEAHFNKDKMLWEYNLTDDLCIDVYNSKTPIVVSIALSNLTDKLFFVATSKDEVLLFNLKEFKKFRKQIKKEGVDTICYSGSSHSEHNCELEKLDQKTHKPE